MKKREEWTKTPLDHHLERLQAATEYQKTVEKMAGALHAKGCPLLTFEGLCTCNDDSPKNPELQTLAMEFAVKHMDSASKEERIIFAYILLEQGLKKAWHVGHKAYEDDDTSIDEQAKTFLERHGMHTGSLLNENLVSLLQFVESKAARRLSEVRTKLWHQIEELVGVEGGKAVVDAVRDLVTKK